METDLVKELRYAAIVNHAFSAGMSLGLSENEILRRLVKVLIDLNDESFQEKLDLIMQSDHPFLQQFKKK